MNKWHDRSPGPTDPDNRTGHWPGGWLHGEWKYFANLTDECDKPEPISWKPSEYIRRGYCKGSFAKDHREQACDSRDVSAFSWCPAGAIGASYRDDMEQAMGTLNRCYKALVQRKIIPDKADSLQEWSDLPETTAAEVIELLETIENQGVDKS
jgi:hypothetical protein